MEQSTEASAGGCHTVERIQKRGGWGTSGVTSMLIQQDSNHHRGADKLGLDVCKLPSKASIVVSCVHPSSCRRNSVDPKKNNEAPRRSQTPLMAATASFMQSVTGWRVGETALPPQKKCENKPLSQGGVSHLFVDG